MLRVLLLLMDAAMSIYTHVLTVFLWIYFITMSSKGHKTLCFPSKPPETVGLSCLRGTLRETFTGRLLMFRGQESPSHMTVWVPSVFPLPEKTDRVNHTT